MNAFTEELTQTVVSVFETMLGMKVKNSDRPWPSEPNRVVASVHFTGGFRKSLMLEASPEQACVLAARFLSVDVPPTIDNDVRDVMGEMANMIGGNLKSVVSPESALSIPEVVDGTNFHFRICGGSVAERVVFEAETVCFGVSLVEARPPEPPAR